MQQIVHEMLLILLFLLLLSLWYVDRIIDDQYKQDISYCYHYLHYFCILTLLALEFHGCRKVKMLCGIVTCICLVISVLTGEISDFELVRLDAEAILWVSVNSKLGFFNYFLVHG